jgi:hypothetical protein
MVFIYVTGGGTDSTEQGRLMRARVKGKTENDLLRLPFKAAYMFRPGAIQPLHGIKSKTACDLRRRRAAIRFAKARGAKICHHHRADRPRHDLGGARRLSPAGAGKRRH